MTYATWREAVADIRRSTSGPSAEQQHLAAVAGLSLPQHLPKGVAAVRLRRALGPHLGIAPAEHAYATQLTYLAELAERLGTRPPACDCRDEADAWIHIFHLRIRAAALKALKLCRGDLVRVSTWPSNAIEEVVSIGGDGVVYFKGGRGARAWPDTLTVAARCDDDSKTAGEARALARNRAAARSTTATWSAAKQALLAAFESDRAPDAGDVDALRSTLDGAQDERPIQQLLEDRPFMLATLMGGWSRYCLPRVSLAGRYVADFFLAAVDSAGVRWVLVELETPLSGVVLSRGNQLSAQARKGVSQVREWREWLQDNLDAARRPAGQNGLGLVDIRPAVDGLVLVGRRHLLRPSAVSVRRQIWEQERIQIRTYDWLVEQIDSARNGAAMHSLRLW